MTHYDNSVEEQWLHTNFILQREKKNDDFSMNSHFTKIFHLKLHFWRENSNILMLIFGKKIQIFPENVIK